MALPIVEQPLYGEVLIETAPWASPFVWTDRTADLVNGVNYSIGGRVGIPGVSEVEVGTLNATFKNMASVPNVGALIRISFSKVAGYAFVGYVQDVSQRIVFDDSVSYTTPITLTTLNCVDWVGYVSQFILTGVGGYTSMGGSPTITSNTTSVRRMFAINMSIDPTGATELIQSVDPIAVSLADTDMVGSISDHLDLATRTVGAYWYPRPIVPTNTTTGRDGLIIVREEGSAFSSGKTFTDVAGTSGQLHYTEIDFESSSQNVANIVSVSNTGRFYVPDVEVSLVGGFNEENFMIINSVNVVGVPVSKDWVESDSTSITTYGERRSTFDTNASYYALGQSVNLIANPSAEYFDDGYSGIASSKVRRRKPLEDANPFSAYNGEWAVRSRIITATGNHRIVYSGGESDGIPVVTGTTYYFSARALRGTASSSNTQAQPRIRFYDDSETEILLSSGSNVALTTANTWYLVSHSVAAPANAVRATVEIVYTRTSGANFVVGDRYWADALKLSKDSSTTFFDGDLPWTTSYGYMWTGGVGSSPSYRFGNSVDEAAARLLTKYSTTSNRVTRIRWNAQESLTSVPALAVGYKISLVYSGTTTTYRIVGIDGNIDPERYMIDYYLTKV